jgi:hypothetical protein
MTEKKINTKKIENISIEMLPFMQKIAREHKFSKEENQKFSELIHEYDILTIGNKLLSRLKNPNPTECAEITKKTGKLTPYISDMLNHITGFDGSIMDILLERFSNNNLKIVITKRLIELIDIKLELKSKSTKKRKNIISEILYLNKRLTDLNQQEIKI